MCVQCTPVYIHGARLQLGSLIHECMYTVQFLLVVYRESV